MPYFVRSQIKVKKEGAFMALIACKECGTEISSKAETCPKCGVKTASKSIGCGGWVLIFIVGGVLYSAFSTNRPTDTTSSIPTSSPPIAASPTPAPKIPGAQWSYYKNEDPMAKGSSYQAVVQSSNTVSFGFPYAGPQHASLILRTHPRYGKDVILTIKKGQFLCRSYEDCKVLIRFDDGQAVTFNGIGPSDNDSTMVFIRNYNRFVENMLKAKKVRISTDIYQNGAPVFEFDVSDFNQSKYLAKK